MIEGKPDRLKVYLALIPTSEEEVRYIPQSEVWIGNRDGIAMGWVTENRWRDDEPDWWNFKDWRTECFHTVQREHLFELSEVVRILKGLNP